MQFGFSVPTSGPLSGVADLTRLAVEGEAMGFDYATFSDHVVIPTDINSRYPYSDTGEFPGGARGGRHELLTEVAFVAAKTSRLRLVTSVMVVPHRPAVLTAKIISTIDVLSGGRLTLGIGAGWLREEFEAIGAPDFAQRGAITDEYLAAFAVLWGQENPTFAGATVKFSNIVFAPKPVQRPGPPIWVGGESGPALRRTARMADGWYPIGGNPAHPLDSLKRFRAAVTRLRAMTVAAGRDTSSVALAYRVQRHGDGVPMLATDGERKLFSGGPADIVADIDGLRSAGVGYVDFSFPGSDAGTVLGAMKRFRDEVLVKVSRS